MKKALLIGTGMLIVLTAIVGVLFISNATPHVPAIGEADIARANKPYVVKLHAQWCPVCRMTKGVWSQIDRAYAGRVHLVVFDFTSDATTNASRNEAKRLGLEKFFEENYGGTGTISVLDARTKEERVSIHGSRDFDEYRAAIDSSLSSPSVLR